MLSLLDEFDSKDLELIDKYPRYKLLSANCQTFTISFLEAICKKSEEIEALKRFSESKHWEAEISAYSLRTEGTDASLLAGLWHMQCIDLDSNTFLHSWKYL